MYVELTEQYLRMAEDYVAASHFDENMRSLIEIQVELAWFAAQQRIAREHFHTLVSFFI